MPFTLGKRTPCVIQKNVAAQLTHDFLYVAFGNVIRVSSLKTGLHVKTLSIHRAEIV